MKTGLFGAFEATPVASVREVFETNTFGVLAMTQAVLPHFRARRNGGGERDLERDAGADADGGGVHREQGGIEGFTASLAFELDAFNVGVKLVEPGYGPSTRFTSNTDRAWKG